MARHYWDAISSHNMQQTLYALLLILSTAHVDASMGARRGSHVRIIPMRVQPNHNKPSPPIPIPKRTKPSQHPFDDDTFSFQGRVLSEPKRRQMAKRVVPKTKIDSAPPVLATKAYTPSKHGTSISTTTLSRPRDWSVMTPKLTSLHPSQATSRSRSLSPRGRKGAKPKGVGSAPSQAKRSTNVTVTMIPIPDEPYEDSFRAIGPSTPSRAISTSAAVMFSTFAVHTNTPVISPETPSIALPQGMESLEIYSPEVFQEDDPSLSSQSPETRAYYEDLAKERYNASLNTVTQLKREKQSIWHNITALKSLLRELESTTRSTDLNHKKNIQEAQTTMYSLKLQLETVEQSLHQERQQLLIYSREANRTGR